MSYKDSMNTLTTCTRCGELIPVSELCPCNTTPTADRLDSWLEELDGLVDRYEPEPPRPPKPAPPAPPPQPANDHYVLSADPALTPGSGYSSLSVAERVHFDEKNQPRPIYYGRAS